MEVIKVTDHGLVATLYKPDESGKRPAVIVLSGSDGGIAAASMFAEPLASLGYAALALAYFAMDGLPRDLVEIPLEYFKRAIDWLRVRPEVDGDRLAIVGMSRGSEAALLAASTYPEIRLAVAVVPSHVVWSGIHMEEPRRSAWTRDGASLPFLSLPRRPKPGEGWRVLFEESLAANRSGEVSIPIERIQGPVLLLSGTHDGVWPSATMADLAMERLTRHAFPYAFEHARYEDAGHAMLSPPYRVGAIANPWTAEYHRPTWGATFGMPSMGGTPEGTRLARMDAWPRMTKFLEQNL